MGVGLDEIGRLVSGGGDLPAVLERRRAELEQERREVDRRLAALDIRVEMAAAGTGGLDVVVRHVAAEPVATLAAAPGGDLQPAFYELEAYVRDSGRRASRPPGTLVGLDPLRGTPLVEVFVPVRGPIRPTERIGYRRLPACRAATMIHHGSYATLGATRRALEGWVAGAGLRPLGGQRILYLQFGAEADLGLPREYLVERDADFVTELQVPVA